MGCLAVHERGKEGGLPETLSKEKDLNLSSQIVGHLLTVQGVFFGWFFKE